MYNEDVNEEEYTEELHEEEVADQSGSVVTSGTYGDEEDDEFQKIRKEHVFADVDFSKRKAKLACTLGYVINRLLTFPLDLLVLRQKTS